MCVCGVEVFYWNDRLFLVGLSGVRDVGVRGSTTDAGERERTRDFNQLDYESVSPWKALERKSMNEVEFSGDCGRIVSGACE